MLSQVLPTAPTNRRSSVPSPAASLLLCAVCSLLPLFRLHQKYEKNPTFFHGNEYFKYIKCEFDRLSGQYSDLQKLIYVIRSV